MLCQVNISLRLVNELVDGLTLLDLLTHLVRGRVCVRVRGRLGVVVGVGVGFLHALGVGLGLGLGLGFLRAHLDTDG